MILENVVVHNGIVKNKRGTELHYNPVKENIWTRLNKT